MMSSGEICARHFQTKQALRVSWEHGVVSGVSPIPSLKEEVWIAPALFDVQVNGYAGVDFQRDGVDVDDLIVAARQLRAAGGTRFLLTLITDEWTKLTTRLRHLKNLREQSDELKRAIVGWHIEGPFLSAQPGFHGAHDPAFMMDPTSAHISELREIAGDDPLLLTIAPERRGAIEAIEFAMAAGIVVSLGHTNAPAEVLADAVEAGATMFTHLANGCPRELDRHDNILWRVFETPGLTIGLIPDRIHVSSPLFRLIHRLEPAIYYTTDAMSAAGAPPGRYSIGKMDVEVGEDQVVRQPGKTNFAGSALRPIDGVFRAAEMLSCPWQSVWQRFSQVPAKLVKAKSAIEVGAPTDFCLLKFSDDNHLENFRIISQSAE